MADEDGLGIIMLKNRLVYKMIVVVFFLVGFLGDLVSVFRYDMMLNRNILVVIVFNFRLVFKIIIFTLRYSS